MIRLPWLAADSIDFPPVSGALQEPDGLLAAGGDLTPARLLEGYCRGIFPWFSDGEPILWWSPATRAVFATDEMHVPRRLARFLRSCEWSISADHAFADVMRACAAPRSNERDTWIGEKMLIAYQRLHALGSAHSIEIRDGDRLIGGVYGVAIGRMFFGESMFSRTTNASKVALLALARVLAQNDCPLLDAQVVSAHLFTVGARKMPREGFCRAVKSLCAASPPIADWPREFAQLRAAELAG